MSETEVSEADLRGVVKAFYARIRADPELGPIFDEAVGDWEQHLGTLAAFWSSVMLGSGRYKGQPVTAHLPHAGAMTPAAVERWLGHWRATTDERLDPAQAALIQAKAARIAESLSLGVTFQRTPRTPAGPA